MRDSSSNSSIWRNQSYRHTQQNQLMLRQSKTYEKLKRDEFQVLTLKEDYQHKRKLLLGNTQCDHHCIKGCCRGQSKLGQGMFAGPDNAASTGYGVIHQLVQHPGDDGRCGQQVQHGFRAGVMKHLHSSSE